MGVVRILGVRVIGTLRVDSVGRWMGSKRHVLRQEKRPQGTSLCFFAPIYRPHEGLFSSFPSPLITSIPQCPYNPTTPTVPVAPPTPTAPITRYTRITLNTSTSTGNSYYSYCPSTAQVTRRQSSPSPSPSTADMW